MVSKGATGVGVHLDFPEINLSHTVSIIEHDLKFGKSFPKWSMYLRKGSFMTRKVEF